MKWMLIPLFSMNLGAQTMDERAKKIEMIKRVEEMRLVALDGEKAFDEMKLSEGCSAFNSLFEKYPNHLTDVATKMDIFSGKVQKMKNESLNNLKIVHKWKLRCERKANFGSVDPEEARVVLESIAKSLKAHRKFINKRETDYNNSYYYYYDFQD